MSIPRFYITEEYIKDGLVIIEGPDLKHLVSVLRCRKGDNFDVFNSSNIEYTVEAVEVKHDRVTARIIRTDCRDAEPSLQVILCQSLPKGQKMDFIVEKAVEIGVTEIQPVITARSINSTGNQKLERWRKIAKSATQQSGRMKIAEIKEPVTFNKALSLVRPGEVGLLFRAGSISLKRILREQKKTYKRIFIFIGPEGDFTEEEISLAMSHNLQTVSLGKRILRTETAGSVALSIILYELEEGYL
ncbi:MAG: 16S rRNA (uracil(1498)-N(3))-methyltransferase [Candidatus Eremiobacterota bacterium]